MPSFSCIVACSYFIYLHVPFNAVVFLWLFAVVFIDRLNFESAHSQLGCLSSRHPTRQAFPDWLRLIVLNVSLVYA
jgi:hypothetical protein